MSFIPKNAHQLLKDSKLMREYALKPFGFTAPTNCNFPKKHPTFKFMEKDIVLHRPGESKKVEPNTLVFKVDENLSKPQIKQYVEKLYNLKVQKVNTARFMGVVKRTPNRKPYVTPSFKKAYVMTEHRIPQFLNQPI